MSADMDSSVKSAIRAEEYKLTLEYTEEVSVRKDTVIALMDHVRLCYICSMGAERCAAGETLSEKCGLSKETIFTVRR